jgi:single-stranded-DNA-specific exonuclease
VRVPRAHGVHVSMILVAPGLLAHPSACRAQPAFARLAHYAGAPMVDVAGLTMLVCAALGLVGDPPVAALMAAGVGLDCGGDYWIKADPVTLVAGRSTVRLTARVDDLDAEEAHELLTALNAHFHSDGLTFVAPRPDTWLARIAAAPDLVTTPLAQVQQGDLHAELPRGGAGPRWRRWQDEIQMLLHGHPVNAAREARGAAVANAVWFWGGGRLADVAQPPALDVDAPEGAIGDLPARHRAQRRAGFGRDAAAASRIRLRPRRQRPGDRPLRHARARARAGGARAPPGAAARRDHRRRGRRRCLAGPSALRAATPERPLSRAHVRDPERQQRVSASIVRRPVPEAVHALAAAGVPAVLARIYAARGIESAAELDHALAALPTFAALKSIDAATARLAQAIRARERIVIVADYDADGATACAVGVLGLRALGADVDYVVPNRFEFGYGLTPEIVALAAVRAPRLLVTVDNGIASHDGVAEAAARGIGRADHGPPSAGRHAARACHHREPEPAWMRVRIAPRGRCRRDVLRAARVARTPARRRRIRGGARAQLRSAARPRRSRHRRRRGAARSCESHSGRAGPCARARRRARPGIAALFRSAGRDPRARRASTSASSPGRGSTRRALADMSLGIRCLLATTTRRRWARARARRLNRERRERRSGRCRRKRSPSSTASRRRTTTTPTRSASIDRVACGVVGIVAARLKDRYPSPAMVFAQGRRRPLKGSGRSIAGFHLRDALDRVAKRAPAGGSIRRPRVAAGVSIRVQRSMASPPPSSTSRASSSRPSSCAACTRATVRCRAAR